jgi:drug/metabolite transporter (DMT)-like permease
LCYGITNSLLGAIYEWSDRSPDSAVSAPFILWATMGVAGLGAAAGFKLSGRGFKGLPSRRFVWVAAAAGVTLSLAMLTLKLGLASDPEAKGPIVAVSSTNALVVALGAWLILHERLSNRQLLGMFVIICGIGMVALGYGAGSSPRGLLYGLATMVLFGTTNLLLKYAGFYGSDSMTTTAILWISAGICGVVALGYSLLRWGRLPGMERPSLFLWAIVAGITLALGMLFIKLAVTRGPGGPAAAISGSNSVLVVVFELVVFAHVPPVWKLVGMGVAIAGILILSLAGGRDLRRSGTEARSSRLLQGP